MKKIITLSFAGALSLMLIGCGIDGQKKEPTVKDETPVVSENATSAQGEAKSSGAAKTEQNNDTSNQEDMLRRMDELNYAEFELEVEYAGDIEYEVELEKKSIGTVKAKIEDSLNHVEKNGTEAFDELYPLVQKLNISQQMDKEEVITEVLKTFNLPTDYTKFDLEITFNDGTKIEFEDKNK
ncbi:YusW family protein [Sporosarcina highlanderae]|uniref:YusW family protein n=1 Tax=Sporosarcina highlanderae TaxID=3035916 RepID=A0ABT8JMX6_9BACL|nr:YusW family protein [Sporosarcina highlanderae]MDN4606292.1 YusW family protein [Sporosarcina highlanderae]